MGKVAVLFAPLAGLPAALEGHVPLDARVGHHCGQLRAKLELLPVHHQPAQVLQGRLQVPDDCCMQLNTRSNQFLDFLYIYTHVRIQESIFKTLMVIIRKISIPRK